MPAEVIKCGPAGTPPAETYMIFVYPLTVRSDTMRRERRERDARRGEKAEGCGAGKGCREGEREMGEKWGAPLRCVRSEHGACSRCVKESGRTRE
jgi:hypothetical protein